MTQHLRHYITTTLLLISMFGWGQTYGNEWINYSQKYYAFKVYPNNLPANFGDPHDKETGIYILDYTTLVNAGIPVSTINTANFQIFGREQEVALHIVDGGDQTMDPGDYILFYTQRNDGWLDSLLYNNSHEQGNTKYSLYNDTIQYFFTWNNSTNNLRYVVEGNSDYSLYTATPYVWKDRWQANVNQYRQGNNISSITSSFFEYGEGWSSGASNGAGTGYTWNASSVQFPGIYQGVGAPDIQFEGMQGANSDFANGNDWDHHVRWRIGASNYVFIDAKWTGYKGNYMAASIPNSVFPASGNSNLMIDIVPDLPVATDYQSISYWSFLYPRVTNFEGQSRAFFFVDNNTSGSKVRLDLSNLNFSNPIVLAHGDVNPKILTLTQNGGVYSTVVTNNTISNRQEIVFQDASTFRTVDTLMAVNGNGTFTDFMSSGNLSAPLLMVYHPKLKSASDNYKAYRDQDYNVVYANIKELYQQFGGGIETHILGIRRFAHMMYANSSPKPEGLFLMGKGLQEANIGSSLGTRKNTSYFAASLIPSYGQPPSDVAITSGIEPGYEWAPAIPTGRISARTIVELDDYLNKVMEFEQQQDPNSVYNSATKDWQKQIIHFGGGSSTSEQNLFQGYMTGMEYIIEDSLFGGNVMRVYKNNSNPLDPTILASVTDRISEGVSILNYFGHASPTNSGFEINLDDPANWNNSGKYPLMLVNSCYNGNVFQYTPSKSEEFVQIPNAGAIAYIASTNIGVAQTLDWYSKALYRQISQFNYGKTIGAQMRYNIQAIEPGAPLNSNRLYYESTCTQMVLNGDPMIRINHHDNPEIELTVENVWFTPEQLDLTVDSIEMHIMLKNLGRSITDTFNLDIRRDFPGTSIDSLYQFKIPELHYTTEFTFKMPTQANIGLGLNSFQISADIPTYIGEQYDEIGNNQILKTLYLNVDGIIPVEPYDFAVVPIDSVTVKASTNNPLAGFNTYRFELDTIDFVGAPSPFHRYAIVSGYGGVKEVNPSEWMRTNNPGVIDTLVCTDSTVYFWRVSISGDTIWREHSFQYINGKEGWGQDHFFQFKKNTFSSIDYDRGNRKRNFLPDNKTLECRVYASSANASNNSYYINSNLQEYGMCQTAASFYVSIIDPVTHEPWGTRYVLTGENLNNNFGNANDNGACRPRSENYFIFRQNMASQHTSFNDFINNTVPNGHYILIYSPIQAQYTVWPPETFATFAALGSDSIYAGRPNLPFAFFCKKGDPNSVVEDCSQNNTDDIVLNATLQGFDNIGIERTPKIGPAAQWHNVYWKQDPEEVNSQDTTVLSISAYNYNGVLQTVIDTTFTLNDSIIDLNALIDANLYPFIDLKVTYEDTSSFTPAQVDRLHVLYSPVPEAAIDGSNQYYWTATNNTIQEGKLIDFAIDVKNIYSIDMDSLLVSYWVEDANEVKIPIQYPRQKPLLVGDIFRDTISIPTAGLSGINSFWMEVNPYINGSTVITDQPEQAHFNNILEIPFIVTPDTINPILDVTFDGTHILNGDIINPTSDILITLKDENEFMIMNEISDTTLFGVYLTNPDGVQKRIPFNDGAGASVMQWVPATAQNKRFKIVWPAEFEKNGTYTLYIQGADKSGNLSGSFEYRVNFEIVRESSITRMMNYPNPFSTSTRFVFTVTGTEPPDDIIIQIMTVSGRVVREITEDQLGPIQIGRNITEYAWDGTDEFGDPLANGVYLYRVKARLNGEDIKRLDSGADQYFEKDFGKMYILR